MSDTSTPDPRPIPVAGDLVLNGPRFADVDALASAFVELEAIVRDLAAIEPLVTKGEPVHGEWEQCGVCGAVNRWVGDNVKHDMSCVWWNAAAWVLDHPVSGDQQ